MTRFVLNVTTAAAIILLASPAFAQSPPTVESVTEEANALIQTLQSQLVASGNRETQLGAANVKLQKELTELKRSASVPKPLEPAKP
jgi:hypothetical protein